MTPEIIILGAGESGIGAALLAQWLGERVFVSDAGTPSQAFLDELFAAGIEYEVEGHDEERILAAKLIIKSPGIPDKVALIQRLKDRGIEVVSEIEFAFRHRPEGCRIVAITGSNGKTTTTMLTNHILLSGGLNIRMGGNIGTSFARLVLEDLQRDKIPAAHPLTYVLELSSFQLDGLVNFRSDISAVLNITPDHLDRYEYQLAKYADSKLSITKNQTVDDLFLVFYNDAIVGEAFARATPASEVIEIEENQIDQGAKLISGYDIFDLTTTQLRGKHNGLNALFAIRIAQELEVNRDLIQTGLDTFQPAAHRMENVATINDVLYINDSKATNVDATFFALDAMTTPVVWIAGGTDKGNDYTPILPIAADKVKALVCLGVDNSKLLAAFAGAIPLILETASIQEALQHSTKLTSRGDTVLLSPACASFDLFKNYIDRGDQFREGVMALRDSENLATSVVKKNNAT